MITFKNLPDTSTPINAENLNANFNELNTKIKIRELYGTINSKTTVTLTDSVDNYDFILVFATGNAYNHRQVCNVLRYNLYSEFVQMIQYDGSGHWDSNVKLYTNICDTTQCELIGTATYHITHILGVKLT